MDYAEHYNAQYSAYNSDYSGYYLKPLEEWALAMNGWGVHFAAGIFNLKPGKDRILDIGSGVGYFLDAWERAGFEVVGVEVSEEAIKRSGRTNILCQSACDLSNIEDDSFSLVFSSAVMEHIADADCEAMFRHFHRIAPYQCHFIAHEKGSDEGHINIKSAQQWVAWLTGIGLNNTFALPNVMVPTMPMIAIMRDVPPGINHAAHMYWMNEQYA